MSDWQAFVAVVGLTVITVVTRGFFLLSARDWPLPPWITRGLRYAPLAALAAIVAPEVLLADGRLIGDWRDPRLFAVAAGTAYFWWQRGILGTIVIGTGVMLALKLGLGW
ncbi:MAG TPA: AzlD domain-containing protein [Gammaproteobacteria bacterium]|jgi:branched-subunit amino acid transport protein|nr:AzlD domain-containing protein [Gammaproteobacteria bacterium]